MFWKIVCVVAVFTVSQAAAGLVGGYSDANISNIAVQDALQFAVVKRNEATNDLFLRQVSNIISAQQQVVSGMNYRFVVELGRTGCRKTGAETECPVHSNAADAKPEVCTFVVYKHWNGNVKLTSHSCSARAL